MSYQVLARKWRPKNFSEMAGQAHVLQTLTHALEQQRLHHAYLFTGTRGVGKTTVARILARCLNCETGITATPCGQCSACREISEGRFIDLIEVDAASRTKVEDTRELLDNVQYAPTRGRFKVYLIDEVHMLSTHSFNALLKTLEEPPPHVKFLLATTDPQKLPVTVLSRCLQFHLKNLSPQQIVNYLQSVLVAEQIAFEEDALWQLARAANGSMRDALTLLDQSISFGSGAVHSAAVTSFLGTPDHRLVLQLLTALSDRNAAVLIELIATAAENNPDFQRLLEQCLHVLHRLALAQTLPAALDNSEGDREQISELANKLTPDDVQLYYQFGMQALQEMTYSPDRRMTLEMALLRMLAFSPDVYGVRSDVASTAEKKKPDESFTNASLSRPVTAEHTSLSEDSERAADVAGDREVLAEGTFQTVVTARPEPEPEPEPEPVEHNVSLAAKTVDAVGDAILPQTIAQLDTLSEDNWYRLVQRCGLGGISGNILWNCVPARIDQSTYDLILDEQQSALYSPDQCATIAEALSDSLGHRITVNIAVGTPGSETPASRRTREKREATEALHQSFYNDPGVKTLVGLFDAKIVSLRKADERI